LPGGLPLPIVLQTRNPIYYQSIILSKAKQKQNKKGTDLTVKEVKDTIYREIQKKQKQVDPEKFNMRIVEDNLAEVEAIQQILAMIMDEERRRERQTNK